MKRILACSLIAACSSRSAPPPAPPQPWQMTGGLEHAMMNCPSAVEGARTRLARTPSGIDVIVTSPDPDARAEIRALADYHARMDRFTEWPEHSGFHGGPGTFGHCPVIHDRTRITISVVPDGAVLHVVALTPEHIASVQEQTAQRLATLPGWLSRAAQPR
jgi:hypothetical protein